MGVQPDILVCRTEYALNAELRRKVALFCNVNTNAVIESIDADSIYDVPLLMLKEKLDKIVIGKLKLTAKDEPNLDKWKDFLGKLKNPTSEVRVALVGKYVELQDAYKSILESFIHAGAYNETKVKVDFIPAETVNEINVHQLLGQVDGVLVAPGFGERGFEGKLAAIKYVRENNIPFFGICLGMQACVVEFARNVLGWKEANTTECDPNTSYPVIDMMEEQKKITAKGATMRLGAYACHIKKSSKSFQAYNNSDITERHRHRWEMNNKYLADYENAGLMAVGSNPESGLVEIVELKKHPYFIGVQFHPELKSTVDNPHPLFIRFIQAALEHKHKTINSSSTRQENVSVYS